MPFSEALQALQRDHVYGLSLSRLSFQPLLPDLTKTHDAAGGRNFNSLIVHAGLASDSLVGDHLIRFFAAHGSLLEASIVFSSISNPTIYTWNFIISAHTSLGEGQRAIELFYEMQQYEFRPDKVIFLCILRTCSMLGALDQGKHVHKLIRRAGFGSDLAVGSTLVDMYVKCGDQEQAKAVFEQLAHKDVVSWNALMSGYLQHGDAPSCLKLYEKFVLGGFRPDRVTFLCLLKAHALVKSLGKCYWLHSEIVITGLDVDLSIGTTLVDMYAKLERLEEARRVFDSLSSRNAVSWNALMSAYAQHGNSEFAFKIFDTMKVDGVIQHESSWNTLISGFVQQREGLLALSVFERMQREGTKPDKVTFFCALKACTCVDALKSGNLIHDTIIRRGFGADVSICNTLIDMYAKSGSIEEARAVFDCMPNRDIVSWNAILVGYAQREQGHPALELFHKSQKEGMTADCFTFSCVLKACGIVGALGQGELIHSQIFESNFEADLVLTSTLVDLYASCGSMEDAKKVFMSSQDKDMALWNAMIGGYAQHALCESVLQCLADMREGGVNPCSRTYINALSACSHRGDVSGGWKLFRLMKEDQKINPSIEHFNAMIDLLGHCGCLHDAKELLHSMPLSPNVTSWLTLLYSCRLHDSKELAEECFSEAVCLDSNVASSYVLMANVYANLNKWEDANKLLKLRKYAEAQKKLGTSWIEVNNTVHEFVIGLSVHPQIDEVYSKFKSLQVLLKSSHYIPQSGLVLEQGADMGASYDRPILSLGLLSCTECTTLRVSFVHRQFIHPVNWIKALHKNTRHPIHLLTKYCFH